MRRAAKVDRNQPEIVAVLRAFGATVQPLHMVGQGCPDLLIGFRGWSILAEIKDWKQPPSARQLTRDQQDWHAAWRGGTLAVIHDVDGARRLLAAVEKEKQ